MLRVHIKGMNVHVGFEPSCVRIKGVPMPVRTEGSSPCPCMSRGPASMVHVSVEVYCGHIDVGLDGM
jgi:hypothetical protein